MSLRILIAEDEMIIAEDMKEMLTELGYTVNAIANNYNQAIAFLKKFETDIVLIDINLSDEKDGIDLVKFIHENYSMPTLYVSSNSDKSTIEKAKKFKSHGFVLKPFSKEDLYTSIEMAIGSFGLTQHTTSQKKEFLFVKEKDLFVKVNLDEILWIKSDQNYLEIITAQKRYLARCTVKDILDQLDDRFVRIQKSYIINCGKVSGINSGMVVINNQQLPIGKLYKDQISKKFETLR